MTYPGREIEFQFLSQHYSEGTLKLLIRRIKEDGNAVQAYALLKNAISPRWFEPTDLVKRLKDCLLGLALDQYGDNMQSLEALQWLIIRSSKAEVADIVRRWRPIVLKEDQRKNPEALRWLVLYGFTAEFGWAAEENSVTHNEIVQLICELLNVFAREGKMEALEFELCHLISIGGPLGEPFLPLLTSVAQINGHTNSLCATPDDKEKRDDPKKGKRSGLSNRKRDEPDRYSHNVHKTISVLQDSIARSNSQKISVVH
jgi:hypothetical protein